MRRFAPSTTSLTNYRLVARWILNDALWQFKRRVLLLGTIGGLGIFMQGSALGAALLYARRLETGEPVDILGRELDPRSDIELLVIAAIAITGALLLAGYLLYRFKSGAISLGREYEALRLEETLRAARRLPHPAVPESAELLQEGHLFQVQQDARHCGRVLRKLVDGLVPLAIVPIVGVILMVLNPALTALLAGITALVASSMFRINRRGARASERMERLGRDASRQRREAVRDVLAGDVRSPPTKPPPRVADTGKARQQLDAYTERLQAIEDSGLASSLVTAVALGAILLLEGRSVLLGQSSLSELLAYLVLLRVFLTKFMQLSRSIAAVSRFYPQVKRHFTFADKARPATSTPPPQADSTCVLRLPPFGSDDQHEHPRIAAGDRLGLLIDGHLTRQSLASLSAVLEPDDPQAQAAHVRLVEAAPSVGINEWAAASGVDVPQLRTEAQNLVSSESLDVLEEAWQPDRENATAAGKLDPIDAWTLGFLTALLECPHALVMPFDRWRELPSPRRRRLLDLARDSTLVFATPPGSIPSDLPLKLMILATAERVVGWSTTSNLEAALEAFRASSSRNKESQQRTENVHRIDEEYDQEEG